MPSLIFWKHINEWKRIHTHTHTGRSKKRSEIFILSFLLSFAFISKKGKKKLKRLDENDVMVTDLYRKSEAHKFRGDVFHFRSIVFRLHFKVEVNEIKQSRKHNEKKTNAPKRSSLTLYDYLHLNEERMLFGSDRVFLSVCIGFEGKS